MNLSDAGIPTTDAFVTRDLSLSSSAALASVCPVGVLPGQVPIQVDAGLFERDVPYIAFTARTDGSKLCGCGQSRASPLLTRPVCVPVSVLWLPAQPNCLTRTEALPRPRART